MDEKKYLARLFDKDEKALIWFIDRYAAYVSAVIKRVTRGMAPPQDIEEAVADVFFVLWNNAGQIQPGKTKAYLASVARNKAKMLLRNRNVAIPLEDDILIISGDDIEQKFAEKEQAAFIKKAVCSMKQPTRDIFLRYYYLYQTAEEIASEMKMNYSTVKTYPHRGRARLKEILTEGGYTVEDSYF